MRLDTDIAGSIDTPMTNSDPAPGAPVVLPPVPPEEPILNTELSFPGPMPPRNLKLGERPDDSADVASRSVVRYIAAAVSGGKTTPGNRNTTTCEKGFVFGSVYKKDVGDGVEAASVITEQPVGMMPKGADIVEQVHTLFDRREDCWD